MSILEINVKNPKIACRYGRLMVLSESWWSGAIEARAYAFMNDKHRTRNFTPSDDALILQQPATGIGVKTLATMLSTSREMLIRRAGELGVSLAISDDHDDAFDTRAIRCSDGLVDPLLERLKLVHGERK